MCLFQEPSYLRRRSFYAQIESTGKFKTVNAPARRRGGRAGGGALAHPQAGREAAQAAARPGAVRRPAAPA